MSVRRVPALVNVLVPRFQVSDDEGFAGSASRSVSPAAHPSAQGGATLWEEGDAAAERLDAWRAAALAPPVQRRRAWELLKM